MSLDLSPAAINKELKCIAPSQWNAATKRLAVISRALAQALAEAQKELDALRQAAASDERARTLPRLYP